MSKFASDRNYNTRFEPFIKILHNSKNVVLIENILKFLNDIIGSTMDLTVRSELIRELNIEGINRTFEFIKKRIVGSNYRLEDCTYSIIGNILRKENYEGGFFEEDEEDKKTKDIKKDTAKRTAIVLTSISMEEVKKFREENKLQDIDENTIEIKKSPLSAMSILNKTFFLEPGDKAMFDLYLDGILAQVEVYKQMEIEEETQKERVTEDNEKSVEDDDVSELAEANKLFKKIKSRALSNKAEKNLQSIIDKIFYIVSDKENGMLY